MSNYDLKVTATGPLDLAYYQRQAELARAEAMREMGLALRRASRRLFTRLMTPRVLRFQLTDFFNPAH